MLLVTATSLGFSRERVPYGTSWVMPEFVQGKEVSCAAELGGDARCHARWGLCGPAGV